MDAGWWVLIVVVAVIVLVGLAAMVVVGPALVLRAIAPGLSRRVAECYRPEEVVLLDLRALTLGVQSGGVWQSRGNGALVLTADALHWFQVAPRRDLRIERAGVVGVATVRSHLGKTVGRDLLHVSYLVNGRPDAVAWLLTDLQAWLTALDAPSPADGATPRRPAPH